MAREEKPYRVYRGGRQKGKVPLQTRPARARARVDRNGASYPGPGPVKVKRRWSRGRKIGIVLALLLLLVVAWGAASYFSLQRGVKVANDRVPTGTSEVLTHQNSLLLSTPTNILILGSDHANLPGREGERSDSIMLLRSDPSRHRIVYLSIPRDLRVPIEGVGDTKINAAMSAGGAPLAIKTVASYTGLPINHVITVDFPRFREVIDALGGITINVPERILSNFDCPLKTSEECTHWKGWRFAKGEQHMNGMRALVYSRVRKNLLNPGRHGHLAHRAPAGRPPGDAAQDDERLEPREDAVHRLEAREAARDGPLDGAVPPARLGLQARPRAPLPPRRDAGDAARRSVGDRQRGRRQGTRHPRRRGQDRAATAASRRGTLRRGLRYRVVPALTLGASQASAAFFSTVDSFFSVFSAFSPEPESEPPSFDASPLRRLPLP